VPSRFTVLKDLTAEDMASLEVYGGFVYQALEVTAAEVGHQQHLQSQHFNIGFHVDNRASGDLDLYAARVGGDTPTYVLNLSKLPALSAQGFSAEKVFRSYTNCAIWHITRWRIVFTTVIPTISGRKCMDYTERQTEFAWFHIYQRLAVKWYLRELQDGQNNSELLQHVFALQAPTDALDGLRRTDLREAIANVHSLMSCGESSPEELEAGRNGRVPIMDVFEKMWKAAEEQRDKVKTMEEQARSNVLEQRKLARRNTTLERKVQQQQSGTSKKGGSSATKKAPSLAKRKIASPVRGRGKGKRARR